METTNNDSRNKTLPGPPTRDCITVRTDFPRNPPASIVVNSFGDRAEKSAQEEITAPVRPAVICGIRSKDIRGLKKRKERIRFNLNKPVKNGWEHKEAFEDVYTKEIRDSTYFNKYKHLHLYRGMGVHEYKFMEDRKIPLMTDGHQGFAPYSEYCKQYLNYWNTSFLVEFRLTEHFILGLRANGWTTGSAEECGMCWGIGSKTKNSWKNPQNKAFGGYKPQTMLKWGTNMISKKTCNCGKKTDNKVTHPYYIFCESKPKWRVIAIQHTPSKRERGSAKNFITCL